ncbi:MAG TPA: hypothetical protein VF146_06430, partial [Bryobacteraceae bacterium]
SRACNVSRLQLSLLSLARLRKFSEESGRGGRKFRGGRLPQVVFCFLCRSGLRPFGILGAHVLLAQADLQGVWVSNSATPLQRPPEFAGKPTLSDAEVLELQKRFDKLMANQDNDVQVGDTVFLSALHNLDDRYQNVNVTDRTYAMSRWSSIIARPS